MGATHYLSCTAHAVHYHIAARSLDALGSPLSGNVLNSASQPRRCAACHATGCWAAQRRHTLKSREPGSKTPAGQEVSSVYGKPARKRSYFSGFSAAPRLDVSCHSPLVDRCWKTLRLMNGAILSCIALRRFCASAIRFECFSSFSTISSFLQQQRSTSREQIRRILLRALTPNGWFVCTSRTLLPTDLQWDPQP